MGWGEVWGGVRCGVQVWHGGPSVREEYALPARVNRKCGMFSVWQVPL